MYCIKCGKENTKEAKFCISCGAELVSKESIAETEKEQKTNKKLRIIACIMLIFIAIIGIVIYISYKNTPSIQIEETLQSGDIDSTIALYYEIEGEESKREVKKLLREYAQKLVEDYIVEAEGVDIIFVSTTLERLKADILQDESEIIEQIAKVKRINESRGCFNVAEANRENGDYAEALEYYQYVSEEDIEYYQSAQELIIEMTQSLKAESLDKAEDCVQKNEYESAKVILQEALLSIPGDSEILAELSIIEAKIKEKDISVAIEEVNTCILNEEYATAFEVLFKGLEKYPQETALTTELESLQKEYKSVKLSELDTYYENEDFSEAILMLKTMQKYLPGDSEINDLLVKYESYLPVQLSTLEIYKNEALESKGKTLEDNFGNRYTESLCFWTSESEFSGISNIVGKVEYLINGEYKYISGDLAYWSDAFDQRGAGHVEIYSDDVLVYSSATITADTAPIHFEVQLGENCHKMTIKVLPENWFDGYVILGNSEVYNR